MTYPQTGWWAKLFVDFDVTVPTPEINVGGAERYPASFVVAVDNPSLSFGSEVRESGEFSVSGLNPQINLEITRVERSFSVNCPDPRMDFLSGERYDEECEIPCPEPTLSFVGRERYPREFLVPVPEPSVNVVGRFIQRASFGIGCPTPTFPMRARNYHAPEEFVFTASNLSWQLPDWCDAYDMIGLGGGGNGNGGGSGYSNGTGGAPGTFAARTIRRGIDIPWETRNHAITVGANSATNMGPIGVAGQGVSAPAGGNGSGWGGQQGLVPGGYTFNNRTYWGGVNNIPASGANYSGWSGCGDGNLGGPGGGGAGGRGALIGGDAGGQGCRGQGWIYCYQLMPPPNRGGDVTPAVFKGGNGSASASLATLPAHQAGDLILIYGYIYPTTLPVAPAAGGTVPQWISVGAGGGGANIGGQQLWYAIATANNHTSGAFTSASALACCVIGNSRGIGATAFDVGGAVASQMTAPALTLVGPGTSQVLHFFGSNANSWNDVAGYTKRHGSTYVACYTKDSTNTAPALTVTNNGNAPTVYRCCSVEILGV